MVEGGGDHLAGIQNVRRSGLKDLLSKFPRSERSFPFPPTRKVYAFIMNFSISVTKVDNLTTKYSTPLVGHVVMHPCGHYAHLFYDPSYPSSTRGIMLIIKKGRDILDF